MPQTLHPSLFSLNRRFDYIGEYSVSRGFRPAIAGHDGETTQENSRRSGRHPLDTGLLVVTDLPRRNRFEYSWLGEETTQNLMEKNERKEKKRWSFNRRTPFQMAQELNLIPRHEDYVNIYTESYKQQVRKIHTFFCPGWTKTRFRSSYFLAPTRRHCSTMAHFPINGRNGWNGPTGRNGRNGRMPLHSHKSISLPHSELFSMLKTLKAPLFVRRDQSGTKKYFSILGCDCGYETGKVLSLCHWSWKNEKKNYFSIFQHAENLWMREWNAVVAVWLHSPSQPTAPIPPSRPFMGEVGHDAAVAPRMGQKVTWAQLYDWSWWWTKNKVEKIKIWSFMGDFFSFQQAVAQKQAEKEAAKSKNANKKKKSKKAKSGSFSDEL